MIPPQRPTRLAVHVQMVGLSMTEAASGSPQDVVG
jgi:hypothetical protein